MANSADPTVPRQQALVPPVGPDGDEGDVTVVGTLKGGTGKTTTANYLAFVRSMRRRRPNTRHQRPVRVLDGDTTSQTTHDWAKEALQAGLEYPVEVERYPFEDIGERLAELRAQGYDVVADIGGGNAALFAEALKQADRLVVPVAPSEFDTRRLSATFAAAQAAALSHARQGFDAYVLLTKCNHQTRSPQDARERLTGADVANPYPVLQAEVSLRVEYERAIGKVPSNLSEYEAVWDEMMAAEARLREAAL